MDEQNKPEDAAQPTAEQPAPAITPTEVPKEVQQEPQQIAAPTAPPTQVYVPRKTEVAEAKPSRWQKFKDFITECMRVLRVTKKPDRMEFKTIVKISGIGMAVIGFLGFFIHFVKELFF